MSADAKKSQMPLIFVIDDDPEFTTIFQKILTRFGMTTEIFSRTEDLLRRLTEVWPSMVIIDLYLEGKPIGYEIIDHIRLHAAGPLPILVVSSEASPVSIAHALEMGASDYIAKPIDREVLTSKLLNYFSSEKLKEAGWSFQELETRIPAAIELELEVREVDEFGIRGMTRHLVSKGSVVSVGGPMVQEIFGSDKPRLMTVAQTWVEPGEKIYGCFLEHDLANEETARAVRFWVTKQ